MKTILATIALVAVTATGAMADPYKYNGKLEGDDKSFDSKVCQSVVYDVRNLEHDRYALIGTISQVESGKGVLPVKLLLNRLEDIRDDLDAWFDLVTYAAEATENGKLSGCRIEVDNGKWVTYNGSQVASPYLISKKLNQLEDRILNLYK